jgi:peptidoglycan hydrolase CwlO-like protein
MSPEKILNDPMAAPFLMGMVVKIKDWAAVKGFVAIMSIIITASFGVGIFYSQTNAMMAKQDEYILKVEKLTEIVTLLQRSLDVTNNNVGHIVINMDKLTAQVGQMQSNIAKIRK